MTKKYEIKVPRSHYAQILAFVILLATQVNLKLRVSNEELLINLLFWFNISLAASVIIIQIYLLTKHGKEIEITSTTIKTKNIELPIEEIEKIIIQGYFVESIGIKRVGKKFISSELHFRFKKDEEKQVKEWRKWAEQQGIPVVQGRIVRWI